jgi:hypothetical protein
MICRRSAFFSMLCIFFLQSQGTICQPADSDVAQRARSIARAKKKIRQGSGSWWNLFSSSQRRHQDFLVPDELKHEEHRQRMMDVLSGDRCG